MQLWLDCQKCAWCMHLQPLVSPQASKGAHAVRHGKLHTRVPGHSGWVPVAAADRWVLHCDALCLIVCVRHPILTMSTTWPQGDGAVPAGQAGPRTGAAADQGRQQGTQPQAPGAHRTPTRRYSAACSPPLTNSVPCLALPTHSIFPEVWRISLLACSTLIGCCEPRTNDCFTTLPLNMGGSVNSGSDHELGRMPVLFVASGVSAVMPSVNSVMHLMLPHRTFWMPWSATAACCCVTAPAAACCRSLASRWARRAVTG